MIFETLMESADKGELILLKGGLLHFHERRDGQVTIREIIVLPQDRGQGVGAELLSRLLDKCPYATSVFAKVPADLEANGWYKHMGFVLEGQDESKTGRMLNLWRKHTVSPLFTVEAGTED